jgi:hypothetical protein
MYIFQRHMKRIHVLKLFEFYGQTYYRAWKRSGPTPGGAEAIHDIKLVVSAPGRVATS